MNNTTDKRNISEEALDEVTGGSKKEVSQLGAQKDPDCHAASYPFPPYSVAELNVELDRRHKSDVNSAWEGADKPAIPAAPDCVAASLSASDTPGIEGSKTFFDNFFEKLWWNISRLFR